MKARIDRDAYWARLRLAQDLLISECKRVAEERLRNVGSLESVSPRQFEDEIAKLYRVSGFEALVTRGSGDLGADVIATRDGERLAIECKRFAISQLIGTPILQRLHSAVAVHRGTRGVLVTTSTFSKPAQDFAQRFNLELVDRNELSARLVRAFGPPNPKEQIEALCANCGRHLLFPALRKHMSAPCKCGVTVECDLSWHGLLFSW